MKNKNLLLKALLKSSINLSGQHDDMNDRASEASKASSKSSIALNSKSGNQIQKKKMIKNKNKLAGAKFRWINEKLYTSSSHDALKLFKSNPDMFVNYHEGFETQVQQWPQNPVDIFISKLALKDQGMIVADMGCGTAKIAKSLSDHLKIYSFDLSPANEYITVADIAHVPLQDETVDIVVFSLSLMGVNYIDFLKEAQRILKIGGEVMIAEVSSRFSDIKDFIQILNNLGFKKKSLDDSNKMFVLFYLVKTDHLKSVDKGLPLKPCIYKRR